MYSTTVISISIEKARSHQNVTKIKKTMQKIGTFKQAQKQRLVETKKNLENDFAIRLKNFSQIKPKRSKRWAQ